MVNLSSQQVSSKWVVELAQRSEEGEVDRSGSCNVLDAAANPAVVEAQPFWLSLSWIQECVALFIQRDY